MDVSNSRPLRLLFVCTGNICRSPLAHGVFDHQAEEAGLGHLFETESAGTHGYHLGDHADIRMRNCAKRHGLRLDHRARKIEPSWLGYYDLVLAMGHDHLLSLTDLASRVEKPGSILLYRFFDPALPEAEGAGIEALPDVPDPYYGTGADFEEVWDIVERCTQRLLAFCVEKKAGH